MMFQTRKTSIDNFLPQTHDAKEESENEKTREHAARCIQKCFRSWLKRKQLTSATLQKFDKIFASTTTSDDKISMIPATHIFEIQRNFLAIYEMKRDSERMMKLCRYLVSSLYSDSIELSYIGVFLVKKLTTTWISVTKLFLRHCLIELEKFSPEKPQEYRFIILRLHTLVSFTSIKNWSIVKLPEMEKFKTGMNKLCANLFGFLVDNGLYPIMKTLLIKGLCRERITLQPVALIAIITLTMRPLIISNMSEQLIQTNLIHILTIPAIMHHLNTKEEFKNILSSPRNGLFAEVIEYLNTKQNLQSVSSTIGGNNTLCLLGNLCELANNEVHLLGQDTRDSCFINVITNLLIHIQQFVGEKKSNATYWHPILGWFERPEDYSIQEVSPLIRIQISHLWTGKIMTELMCKPLQDVVKNRYESNTNRRRILGNKNVLNRTLRTWMNRNNCNEYSHNLSSQETRRITSVCSLYYTALCTLKEMKSMILTGLCFKDKSILLNLWLFLSNLWSHDNFEVSIDYLLMNLDYNAPEIKTLMLFCDCMSHYVTILDDVEMYEQQDPFKLSDFVRISYFLNHFLYKYISKNDSNAASNQNPLFTSLHTLLISIHRRDCQKSFCSPDHWLIKEIRVSSFIADLAKGKQHAIFLLSKIPHIIPHSERVILFRRYISEEKSVRDSAVNFETSSTLITIHRSSILEDGYRQLSILSPEALKGVIRVRFINEQGLDEAGIDQDGVFKEFLEETIKRVFDPSLDLFKSTSGNRLYPSSTSYVQENHLQLFEFVGRMLGKAIYEGIVIDVPFASFFVTQFCGQAGGILYSCLDELASLDCDLYRSLTMVKRYEGDVADLQLTFSVDQECMGKVVTYELKPGGKAISVTNENKIIYIHSMARFRMYVQIKDQIMAFTKGFRSIIKPEWFSLFSTPEWQRLISGDNAPLNLKDLRKYTQYYGGFHDKHRVICWLWDILDKDFSEVEKGLFLKFVTSCSRSPLLGFAHLEPPFSIRCIEVSDDEDNGDTIGSVFRGFFTIRKKDPQNRLPTSSTCFNLLKLPNYRNKQILREKLRYAVTSNTGFELS